MTPELKQLLEYIAREMEVEPISGIMPYGPVWVVGARGLLKEIQTIYNLRKDEVGDIVNPIRKQIEESRQG